jgi:glycosyltransferase involved in cell wall biosynthesis
MSAQPCIHLWCSGIEETGGIQHYSQCAALALAELFPDHSLTIFSKNDTQQDHVWRDRIRLRGFGSRTWPFVGAGLRAAVAERPRLILSTHPHFTKALWPLILIGTPCLSVAHGIETWGHLSGGLGSALRKATGVLPVSQFTADCLKKEGQLQEARLRVVPNTFREEAFETGTRSPSLMLRYGLKPDQPILLTVGRLATTEQYKGQDQIIQAMPAILAEMPDLRYLIGGRGDDESRLRKLAKEKGVEKEVIFAGFIPESELADHYRLADLYVMPSTGEGFGIVYLESLACGRPCLVGNQDASPEAIDGGRLGMVVNPRDPQAIAEAILRFFRRQHDQPWLHEPETLRREVVRLFGKEAFKQHLSLALKELLPSVARA